LSPTITVCSVPVDDGLGEAVPVLAADVDDDAAVVDAAVVEGAAPPVAAALKASNLSPGLTAKTIPLEEQWFP
jgi:hypothetical protein